MTYHVASMLKAYPKNLGEVDQVKLAACIAACFECARTCTACADACLSEDMVEQLTTCVRTNLDCAGLCETSGKVLSRHTGYDASIVLDTIKACWIACKACADECEKHESVHEHCRICAETCRRCAQACADLVEALGRTGSF
ncbi:Domain of Uncharacterised Function (DUF326) [Kocuria rosea]|uniref:four-helix bundle copper-binding protein n=1 Tax=Kocuria rosea TaxID=1275 RepID=UPI000F6CF3B3|nr:four-helix bundle copper-binding protein [Kocuria rosea]VEH41195.1 Domain of Uncharacterised Function (DUF326) [Kocuria rosea]